jgi:hypothetical protein
LHQFESLYATLHQFAPLCTTLHHFAPIWVTLRHFAPLCITLHLTASAPDVSLCLSQCQTRHFVKASPSLL